MGLWDKDKYTYPMLVYPKDENGTPAEEPAPAPSAQQATVPSLNGENLTESYSDVFERLSPPPAAQQYYDLAGQALGSYANGTFNYDFNTDPVFQLERQRYLKQGELNARDVAARAAALTGGYGNSYGTVAAQQAMNAANDNVNAIIPDLQNAAYSRWKDDQNKNLTLAQTYYQMANDEYDRAWQDKLHARQETEWGQQDEMFDLNKALEIGRTTHDWSALANLGYNVEILQNDEAAQREFEEWLRNRQKIEAEHADIDWENGQKWNEISHALQIGQATNDWSEFERLGFSAEYMKRATALQEAITALQYGGDYGPLAALGFDVSNAEAKEKLEVAAMYAEYHDYSKLKELGVDTSYLEILDQLALMAKYSSGGTVKKDTGADGNGKTPIENFFGDQFSNYHIDNGQPNPYEQSIVYKSKDGKETYKFREENGVYYVSINGKWRKLNADGNYE